MSAPTADWRSVASTDLLVSFLAPRTWDARPLDERRVEIAADQADEGGYRARLGLFLGKPEETGAEWFTRFCEAAPEALARTIEAFALIDTGAFRLSSHAKVFAVSFHQHAAGLPPTSHLQAYVWANSHRMYLLDGATLRQHEARDLPVFDAVLRSLRVLPPRP